MSAFEDWWKGNGGGTGQQFVDMQKGWDAAIKFKEAQPQADNTGSPKLPSIEECYKAIPFPEDDHEQAYFVAGIAECHIFIARQLSGRA